MVDSEYSMDIYKSVKKYLNTNEKSKIVKMCS